MVSQSQSLNWELVWTSEEEDGGGGDDDEGGPKSSGSTHHNRRSTHNKHNRNHQHQHQRIPTTTATTVDEDEDEDDNNGATHIDVDLDEDEENEMMMMDGELADDDEGEEDLVEEDDDYHNIQAIEPEITLTTPKTGFVNLGGVPLNGGGILNYANNFHHNLIVNNNTNNNNHSRGLNNHHLIVQNNVARTSAGRTETWGVKVWSEWSSYRNQSSSSSSSSSASKSDQKYPIPVELHSTVDTSLVEYWMPYFLMEVKSKTGDYTPDSLKQLVYGIYRHLREHCNYTGDSWLSPSSNVGKALYARIREIRRREGNGMFGRRFRSMTRDDEITLWETGVLNLDTSQGLLYAVFIYNGKVLGVRGRNDHRALNVEQFVFKKTPNGKESFLEFWPHNVRRDSTNHNQYKTAHSGPIRHYEDPKNPRSYYKIIHLYLSAVGDKCGSFYRKPLPPGNGNLVCFSRQPIGINQIGGMLKKIYETAGLHQSTAKLGINNRALKVTTAMDLHRAGVKRKFIQEMSGQRTVDSHIPIEPNINHCLDLVVNNKVKTQPLVMQETEDVTIEVQPSAVIGDSEGESSMSSNSGTPTGPVVSSSASSSGPVQVEKRDVPKTKFSCGYNKDNKFTIQIDLDRKMGSVCSLEVRNEGKQVRMYFD